MRTLILRRERAEFVNNYNRQLLLAWQANNDLSPMGPIGELVRYVSDYMSKSEPVSLDNEITHILQRAKSEGSSGKCAAIQKLAKLLEAKRLVSIQEAVFLLLHLPYRLSSRKSLH